MFCAGVIQSGKNKGELCQCYAKSNGYCGRHQKQGREIFNMTSFVNNSQYNIEIEYIEPVYGNSDEIISYNYIWIDTLNQNTTSEINLYDSDITDYRIIFHQGPFGKIEYCVNRMVIKHLPNPLIIISDPIDCTYHPILNITYKNLYEDWKKVALKALHLPKDIKKLTNNDTVKEMCDMTEYIDLPEEICERDYQLAGATYNPDDEDIETVVDHTLEVD
tara:strand:- start:597 stop:1253 length:657 start_codon:yes stop_codon:yes gene_type:complete